MKTVLIVAVVVLLALIYHRLGVISDRLYPALPDPEAYHNNAMPFPRSTT